MGTLFQNGWWEFFLKFLPYPALEQSYGWQSLKADMVAGLTVALVLIPQSMAYARLAGLPPVYGLYASFLPPIVASLMGSSRQLATGPVAVVSLMTAVALEPMAASGLEGYIAHAILLAFLVGAFQLLLGVLKLGMVVNLISHPVVNGFTNAAAIIIATSQLPSLLGIKIDRSGAYHETLFDVIAAASHYLHWPTVAMGVLAFGIIFGMKHFMPRFPNVLAAVAITTTLSWAMDFEHNEIISVDRLGTREVREMVVAYDASLKAMPSLLERREATRKAMNEAKLHGDVIARLELLRKLDTENIQLEILQYNASRFRKRLRRLIFFRKNSDTGEGMFYLKDKGEKDMGNDGLTWRMEISGGEFDPDSIPMIGGGRVIGYIPPEVPVIRAPAIGAGAISDLLPFAVIISLLGFMEAISVAKVIAARTGQHLDPNRELIGQGLGNLIGSFNLSYPTSGSFSRSAINYQTGAVSGLSGVFTGVTVLVAILVFTPLLYHLPQSVLAAIIMAAVVGLVNVSGFIHLWRAQWFDGAISLATFFATLLMAPHLERGIMLGVGLSLAVLIYKGMRPRVVDLSLDVDKSLHDAVTFGLEQCKYIDVVRFDGALFFANASYMEDQIFFRMKTKKLLKHIIIVANGINDMDASGEEALSLIVSRVRSAGVDISFSGVNEFVMMVLKRTHLLAKIGEDHIYPNMGEALRAIHEQTHGGGLEKLCPLTSVVHLA